MKFEIDFNHNDCRDDKLLVDNGAKLEHFTEYDAYFIELNTFEELEELLKKINKNRSIQDSFNALVTFDSPMIFLDNKS